ncbi:glycosyltransferase [Paractinoplanes lichenicola]|uniref:Glycosyltransferase family 1 protein n=1 Tax=Paractinoplanes lichenicola TaxID=2802976 RepID=A0ABS1VFD7_9ACTN|nr:glycosyltransferase [Actinoplanes lichenicola]MBL7253418.1 glycosyltransferase family 1 protein [Actinoplanes lichenicola]
MRVLFASLGNYGHIFPLVPLAQAAQSAGHEVWFATSEQFHPILEKAGLRPVAAGLTVPEAYIEAAGGRAAMAANGPTKASDIPAEVMAHLSVKVFSSVLPRSVAADLAPVLGSVRPDLVVYETNNTGAAFAAAEAGVPAVSHGIGRVSSDATMDPLFQQELIATAIDLGVIGKIGQTRTLGNPHLDICPPSVQNPDFLSSGIEVIPQRPVAFAEPGELPAHVTEGEGPLVYLSLGTVLGSAELLRTAIDGLLPLNVRVLVATGPVVDPAELGELPERVVALPWVPQPDALRLATAVVHHGGAGTTLAALAAGLPQLILPQPGDGPGNAAAVQATGAGSLLPAPDVSAEAVETAVRALLTDDSYREAARGVAREIAAMPEPAETVARFGEFVR